MWRTNFNSRFFFEQMNDAVCSISDGSEPTGGGASPGASGAPGEGGAGGQEGGSPDAGGDVNDIVNKAIASRMARMQKNMEQSFAERFDSMSQKLTSSFTEQFQVLSNQMKPPENLDELGRMKKRLEHTEAENQRLAAEMKRRDEQVRVSEEARKKAEERQIVSDSLRGAGVADHFIKPAMAMLLADGRVGRDKSDKIVWLTGDEYDPYKPFDVGFKEWAENDGKIFRSAVMRPGEGGGDHKNGQSRKPEEVSAVELSSWLQS